MGAVGQVVLTVAGVVLAIVLAPFTPWFDQALSRWHYVEPSCEDPRGLEKLDVMTMVADERAVITATSEVDADSSTSLHAFDGRPGSGWVPSTISARGDEAAKALRDRPPDSLSITLTEEQPVELLCVVNGNAADPMSYARADRVRTARVMLHQTTGEKVTRLAPLRSLPENEIQNRQDLGVRPQAGRWSVAEFTEVSFTVVDRYLGFPVDDPRTTAVVDEPTGRLMVAELELWVRAG